jgi:hypothetical protein
MHIYTHTYRPLLRRLWPIVMTGEINFLRLTIKLPRVGRRRDGLVQGGDGSNGVIVPRAVGFRIRIPVPPEFARGIVCPCSNTKLASIHVGESRDNLLYRDISVRECQVLKL